MDATIKNQLQQYLVNIKHPVEIHAALDDQASSKEMRVLLKEIASLSNQLIFKEDINHTERTPSFALKPVGKEMGVRFAGIPMGHEFTSLVLALLQVGGHPPKVEADLIERIRQLDGDYHFETYISLTCQNCPEVVQALNVMAVINPRIKHVMIDGGLYQEEVNARQIMAVPSIYLNGQAFGQGRMELDEILAKLDVSGAQRDADKLNDKPVFDMLIVGGGPAASAAAIYAARKGLHTGIVADRFGGQVLDTLSIENFISAQETEGPKLVHALEQHVKSYDVDVMKLQRASALIPGELFTVQLESGASLQAKSVIIATGARWRELNVQGEQEYRNRGVAYCPHCDGPLFKGKPVAVVGGGNSGVEAAIDLAGIVSHVTLLEYDVKLRADEVLQRKLRSLSNVTIITSAQTTEVTGDGNKVNGLRYRYRSSGTEKLLALDGIFVQIGLLPNTDWLKNTVALSARGEIEIDAHGQTSVPGVFAAGDVTTVPYKQIIIALGEGSKAALGAFDYLIRASAPTAEAEKLAA
jgi:alkyl hydroperoxide reductase subunit F